MREGGEMPAGERGVERESEVEEVRDGDHEGTVRKEVAALTATTRRAGVMLSEGDGGKG